MLALDSKKNTAGPARKETIITLRDLTKTYELPAGEVHAVNRISLDINESQFVTIVGKSGSGKTTLVNLLTAIDKPTSGTVFIRGKNLDEFTNRELTVWRGKHIGVVFQFFQLLPTLTVLENVLLPMDFCNVMKPSERRDHAMGLLEKMGIASHADKLPAYLSGGENQRAAIARALSNDPPLICADEPTGNLDSETADRILELFSSLRDNGKTILMVTHERDISGFADREITLRDGKVVSDRTVEK